MTICCFDVPIWRFFFFFFRRFQSCLLLQLGMTQAYPYPAIRHLLYLAIMLMCRGAFLYWMNICCRGIYQGLSNVSLLFLFFLPFFLPTVPSLFPFSLPKSPASPNYPPFSSILRALPLSPSR